MWARVTTIEGTPDQADIAVKLVEENVIPAAKQWQGFSGGWWLLDRATGRMIAMTLWDSEETLNASAEAATTLRKDTTDELGGNIVSVESYEVAAKA
ncbi:MAG TPA: hypothetical protein VGB28_05225 [Actinomycetota bacterium]|jgi:hypothetical protein